MHADYLITQAWVLTMDANASIYYPGSVVIKDDKIQAVGPSDVVDDNWEPQNRIEAREHVLMPGLINIHGHASNSLIRGLGGDLKLQDWLSRICWPMMAEARDEDLYNGVLLSALEMLLNGITTFADMWTGVGSAAEAVMKSGLRAMLAHNIKDLGDAARGELELQLALDAYHKWHGNADGRVMVGLGPHSVYTCQPELLKACAQEARTRGIHVQVHASETLLEVEECRTLHQGKSPVQVFEEVGLLGEHTIAAHAVWVDEGDIVLLKQSGTSVAHNISSNLKLGSGVSPVKKFIDTGICVGIGTDGPGSNDGLDILRDLRVAVFVQRGSTGDACVLSADQALRMATIEGAKALGIEKDVGSIEVGKKADLILIDLDKPHLTPHHCHIKSNILSLLVFCASGRDVDHVFVDGELLLADGRTTQLEPCSIKLEAQRSSQRLVKYVESL